MLDALAAAGAPVNGEALAARLGVRAGSLSVFILDAIHNRDGGPRPEVVITDTASYSDIVFGLFAICGYQFSPRLADITDSRLWVIDPTASYGPFDQLARHRIRLESRRAAPIIRAPTPTRAGDA